MSIVDLYALVPIFIPPWLLWGMMALAGGQWLVWQRLRVTAVIGPFDLGGVVAPLLPWLVSYALIFYESSTGASTDLLRGVALSRLSLAWMLLGLNWLLARPLYRRYMNRDRKRLD